MWPEKESPRLIHAPWPRGDTQPLRIPVANDSRQIILTGKFFTNIGRLRRHPFWAGCKIATIIFSIALHANIFLTFWFHEKINKNRKNALTLHARKYIIFKILISREKLTKSRAFASHKNIYFDFTEKNFVFCVSNMKVRWAQISFGPKRQKTHNIKSLF